MVDWGEMRERECAWVQDELKERSSASYNDHVEYHTSWIHSGNYDVMRG